MKTEIITAAEAAAAELRQHAETINDSINLIVQHEEAFKESTLEPCLLIGREITKAQELFGIFDHSQRNIEGRNQHTGEAKSRPVTRPDSLGFAAWLGREIPRLKKPTAYKYATCFKALGLPVDAPDSKITAKIKDLRHVASRDSEPMPSLNTLYKAGLPPKDDAPRITHKPDPEDLAGEGRVQLHDWMGTWDTIVRLGYLEPLSASDLQPVMDFLTTCRDLVRLRIKSSR